jgi:tetratricopeptide (TPR) repeat protein
VQTSIAQGVAAKLGHELTGAAAQTLARPESSSAEAYDLYLQGAEYLREGDRESSDIAYEFFARALTLDPNLTDAHVGRGAAYLERFWNGWGGGSGNLGLAEKSFQTALQRDAGNIRARRGLNLIEWYRGRGESHLRFARDAARRGEDDIETLLARGEVFTIDGPEDLAEPILNRVLALDPWNQAAAWHLTVVYHTTERFKDAVKAADDYIRRFDHDPLMDTLAASALEWLGDLDSARDRHDRATGPVMQQAGRGSATWDDLNALLLAGTFHNRYGRRERAEAFWQQGRQLARTSLENDPESIGMRFYYTSFLVVLGDRTARKEEADAYALAEAADINPLEQRYLASAHAHVGNTARALEVLRYALRRGRVFGRAWLLAPELERADGFDDFKREDFGAEQRRRRLYGPGS